MARFALLVLPILLLGCQSTEHYGLYRPANDPLGSEVNQPFQDMIDMAWRGNEVIGEVYFEYDKAELSESAKERLQEMVSIINRLEGQVIVAGHADHNNTEQYNIRLGYQRAIQVAGYLKSAGVWDERMVIRSLGESRPAATNWNDAGQAINRRVVIAMFDQGEGMNGKEAVRVNNQYKSGEGGDGAAGASIDSGME